MKSPASSGYFLPRVIRRGIMADPTIAIRPLSRREFQTLGLLLDGLSEKEAARAMSLSVHTLHVHVKSIYRAFGVTTRAELMAMFLRIALTALRSAASVPPSTVVRESPDLLTVRPLWPKRAARHRPNRHPGL